MREMTGRERVLVALRRQQPDRVPYLESVIEEAVGLDLLGIPRPPKTTKTQPDDDDPVSVGAFLKSEYYRPQELAENVGLDGIGTFCFPKMATTQQESAGRKMVSGGTIRTRADLAHIHLPDPDDPALYEPHRRFIAENRSSGRALFCFFSMGSDPVVLGMGLQAFALALYDDRSLVDELFDIYSDWSVRVAQHLNVLGFDFLWLADDIAFKTGPFVSPRVFRTLVLPRFRRVVEQVTLPWIFHSDGNVLPILDDLLTLGMSGLHPCEPDAMDLGKLKRRYGKALCLCGGISVDALGRGTPEQVDGLVREAIQAAAAGGGYICGSSNSVPDYCRAENVRAMAQAIRKYGCYRSDL